MVIVFWYGVINLENETYWVTYLNPFRIIKHTNESIKFSLDEINYVTYDSSILCRMIGTIVSIFQGAKVEYIICGDGAIAISRKNTSFTSNDLLLIYNDFLCKLLIGGIYVEAIDNKDIDILLWSPLLSTASSVSISSLSSSEMRCAKWFSSSKFSYSVR